MKWNASALAALFLLTACGGGGGLNDYSAPESAGSQGSPAARTWDGGGSQPIDADLQQPQGAPQAPGASYQRPGSRRGDLPQTYHPQADRPSDGYQDPTAGATGPRGTAGGAGPRADEVGYAGTRGVQGEGTDGAVVAVHRSLPAGTVVEVTNLETGRTILVLVTGGMGQGADHLIDLSPGATRQLGATASTIAVRVRRVTASPQDERALQSGQPATERNDTPPVLLNALRKSLPAGGGAVAARPSSPSYAHPSTPARNAPPRAAASGRFYVQVAALSNSGNAQGLAQSLHGFVKPAGGLYRVQMGPFRNAGEAEAARADAARRGYGDARVFTQN